MPQRPLFSIGASTVADRLRHLTPDVPEVILKQAATDVEKHLLRAVSCLDQQNVIIGEVMDAVLVQTTATNGRVRAGEDRDDDVKVELAKHNSILKEYEQRTKNWRRWQALAFPVGTALLIFVLEILSKHFHWTS